MFRGIGSIAQDLQESHGSLEVGGAGVRPSD